MVAQITRQPIQRLLLRSVSAVVEVVDVRMIVAIAALMLAAPCRSEPPAPTETDVIAYAKQIDVAKLDSTLQTQPIEEWLRSGPMRADRLDWQVSDCDVKPDYKEPSKGYPLCAKIVFQRERVSGWIIINVGTKRQGVAGPPRFESAVATTKVGEVLRSENAKNLSDLPHVMSKLLAEP